MRILVCLAFVVALAVTAGCASNTAAPTPAGEDQSGKAASARAEARWKAMIAKDFDAAHAFLSPGSKAANPPALFKSKFRPLDWKKAEAVGAHCEGDKCLVKIRLTIHDMRLGGEVATVYEETWLKDSGQWWLVFN